VEVEPDLPAQLGDAAEEAIGEGVGPVRAVDALEVRAAELLLRVISAR
jgi:hypothetical protein